MSRAGVGSLGHASGGRAAGQDPTPRSPEIRADARLRLLLRLPFSRPGVSAGEGRRNSCPELVSLPVLLRASQTQPSLTPEDPGTALRVAAAARGAGPEGTSAGEEAGTCRPYLSGPQPAPSHHVTAPHTSSLQRRAPAALSPSSPRGQPW